MHRWLSEQRPRTTSAGRTPACSRTPQAIDTKALPPAIATLGMIRTALFQKVRATRTFFLVEFTGYRRSASPLDNEGRGLKRRCAGARTEADVHPVRNLIAECRIQRGHDLIYFVSRSPLLSQHFQVSFGPVPPRHQVAVAVVLSAQVVAFKEARCLRVVAVASLKTVLVALPVLGCDVLRGSGVFVHDLSRL